MGAITATLFALVRSGDHVVVQTPIYGGTHEVTELLKEFGVEVTSVLLAPDGGVADFTRAARPNTKVFYCETPANPICGLIDLRALSTFAKV